MIIRWTRADRLRLLGTIALSALAGVCGVGLLAVSAWLLSRAAEHPPVLFLMVAIVGVRAFGLGRAVFRYLERLVGHDLALRLQAGLRTRTYAGLARSTWLGRRGDLLARVTQDVAASEDLVVRAIVPLASAAVVLTLSTSLIMIIDPTVGLVLTVCVVLAGVVVPLVAGRVAAGTERALAPLRGRLAEATAEAERTASDLLLLDATDVAADAVRAVDDDLRAAERRSATWSGLAAGGQLLATGAAVLGALWLGAAAVLDGGLAPVLLAVLVLTPLALHEVLGTVPPAVQAGTRALSALGRVAEVLAAPPIGVGERTVRPGTDDGPDEDREVGPGRIDLTGLSVGWPGAATVVEGLDLRVDAGERVALVGPSGIGKTTVAATVLGLLAPRRGTVRTRGSVGYLAQDAYVFDTTVAENVGLGRRDATAAEISAALAAARLPLDPARLVGANGARLSGGEQRRLALSRLLLRDDAVIILDEPTEHVDRPTAAALVDDLWERTTDRAVLVITHDPDVISRCDRVIRLGVPAP